MSKKKVTKKKKVEKPSSITETSTEKRTQIFTGNILREEYDEEYLKRNKLYGRTLRRKMRYWCFKHKHEVVDNRPAPNSPEGLKEFVEQMPGFAGWENFAKSWDIQGENPFTIVLRLESVESEWDHIMNRVAMPIDLPPDQINARMDALAKEYAKNN